MRPRQNLVIVIACTLLSLSHIGRCAAADDDQIVLEDNITYGRVGDTDSLVAQHLYALDSQGKRVEEIPVSRKEAGRVIFELGPKWTTLFYELSDK